MRIVLGVLEADRGEVRFGGSKVDFAVRTRFGYMPEERCLYPKMRVRDQLVYLARLHGTGTSEAARAADRWIERLGLTERAPADRRRRHAGMGDRRLDRRDRRRGRAADPAGGAGYAGGVLRTGSALKLREAWRAARA
jgi:ABC-type multidrug transport system ATPase subunit